VRDPVVLTVHSARLCESARLLDLLDWLELRWFRRSSEEATLMGKHYPVLS